MTSKHIITAFRLLFGIHFLINGLNYTFHFFEIPTPPGEMAVTLHAEMVRTGMFNVAKGVEIVTGVMLLANAYVPLALVLAFPVTCIIAFVDVFLTGRVLYAWAGILTLVLNGGLMLAYFRYYRPMLEFRAEPGMK